MLVNHIGPSILTKTDLKFSAEATGAQALDESLLPEWRLEDLYASMDAPELIADFERARSQSVEFEEKWKGKLAVSAANGKLGMAVQAFEELQELMGRIGSYAGLLYTGDTSDPARVKFYGDAQQKLTDASSHLLFFGLDLNLLEDEQLQKALAEDSLAAHYRTWLEDLRKEKPYQLEDRVEQLFHEKALTGSSAFNRLFDETTNGLRFEIDGEPLPLERAFNHLQDPDEPTRAKAFKSIAAVFNENIRTFSLITNTLAKDKEISDRWRGFEDVADSRHLDNRVEREVVDALVAAVRESYPRISHRYYAMKAKWLGMDKLQAWDRNAPLPETPDALVGWPEAKNMVLSAYHGFLPEMADIARQFFDRNWIDAPAREGKAPGAFAHPTVPSAHPYVLLNYLG
ncbi:MAG: M3 family metallopeptidase, partial [Pseudomonadota bacterium]